MQSNTSSLLKTLGLKDAEIRVYLAGLKLGSATIRELASETKLQRTMLYPLIESLSAKRLATYHTSSGIRQIDMAHPSMIKSLVEHEQLKLAELTQKLPELEQALTGLMLPVGESVSVRFAKGEEEIERATWQILKTKNKCFYAIASIDSLLQTLSPAYFKKFFKTRDRLGIASKALWTQSLKNTPFRDSPFRDLRILPKCVETLTSTIYIYDDTVIILPVAKPPYCIVIHSASYAQSMRVLFELLWTVSKRDT